MLIVLELAFVCFGFCCTKLTWLDDCEPFFVSSPVLVAKVLGHDLLMRIGSPKAIRS